MTSLATARRPFIDHLTELRTRSFWCVATLLVASGVAYFFYTPLEKTLLHPLGQTLYYTSPVGGFEFVFRICITVGLIVTVPVILYHLLRFLAPALPAKIDLQILRTLFFSSLLLVAGVAFGYFVALPATLHFLGTFGSPDIKAIITTGEYGSFLTTYLAAFAIIFQLPLIFSTINRITPLKPETLTAKLPYIILGSFVLGAVLTPTPDPINQTIMALPIILLYLVGVLAVAVNQRPQPSAAAAGPGATLSPAAINLLDSPAARLPSEAKRTMDIRRR